MLLLGAAEETGGGGAAEETGGGGATEDEALTDDTGAAGVDEGVGAADETGALPGVGLNNKVKRWGPPQVSYSGYQDESGTKTNEGSNTYGYRRRRCYTDHRRRCSSKRHC